MAGSVPRWLAGLGHSLSPAGWHLPGRQWAWGLDCPLRTGALTARLRKRKPGRGPSVPCPSTPRLARLARLARWCRGPSANPGSTHTPPSEPSTDHRTTSLACLVFSCLLSPCQSSSCHHITSPRIAHRIASQLPSVDVSASRPVPPIDFFPPSLAFAFRQDD